MKPPNVKSVAYKTENFPSLGCIKQQLSVVVSRYQALAQI